MPIKSKTKLEYLHLYQKKTDFKIKIVKRDKEGYSLHNVRVVNQEYL